MTLETCFVNFPSAEGKSVRKNGHKISRISQSHWCVSFTRLGKWENSVSLASNISLYLINILSEEKKQSVPNRTPSLLMGNKTSELAVFGKSQLWVGDVGSLKAHCEWLKTLGSRTFILCPSDSCLIKGQGNYK